MTTTTYAVTRQQELGQSTLGLPCAVGFYFAFRLFTVLLSVRVLGADPQTGVEINLVLNILFVLALIFASPGAASQSLRTILRPASVRWAMLFLVFSGCSLLWTVAVSISAAAAFWCAFAADALLAILLLRASSTSLTVSSFMKGYVWGACAIAIIAWILPAQSDLRLGDEELLGTNQIGYLCAFAIYLAQYLSWARAGRWSIPILLLSLTLLRSLSKTTILAFVISQGFVLLRDSSMTRRQKVFLMLATLAAVGAFAGLLSSYYDVYLNAGNQSETLTGRLGIWAYMLAEAIDKPWIGHGFHSVWKVVPPFGPDLFEARHAHNELLQQFYAYGVAGVILFAGIYGSLFLQIRRLATGPMKTFFFSLLIFVLIRGLGDTEPFDLSLPLWMIILMGMVMPARSAMKKDKSIVIPL